jgi:hypothetical protein
MSVNKKSMEALEKLTVRTQKAVPGQATTSIAMSDHTPFPAFM